MNFWPRRPQQLVSLLGIALLVGFTFILNTHFPYLSPLFLSLVAGLVLSNFPSLTTRGAEAINFSAKNLLRIGVALLGMQITFHKFAEIGVKGFIAIFIIVILTFFGMRAAGRMVGLSPELSLLLAGGFSICGASAIAAIGASRKSKTEDISYSVGIVTLCGTLSIFVIPPIAKALSLSHQLAGAWIGAAVHDIGQVIATATLVGGTTLSYAVISKLSRIVLLAPMLVALNFRNERKGSSTRFQITQWFPPFILGFLFITLLNNEVHFSTSVTNSFINISKFLLSMGLFAMGTKVKWASIKVIGVRPLVFGVCAWIVCGGFSLLIMKAVGV